MCIQEWIDIYHMQQEYTERRVSALLLYRPDALVFAKEADSHQNSSAVNAPIYKELLFFHDPRICAR
jgi:hypothetical protein